MAAPSGPREIVVVAALKPWTCCECLDTGALLTMTDGGPLCMSCADLEHLVLLPSGDAALTRRAKKGSRLSAVVIRFSRARGRYERQGLLVEEDALVAAEEACLADEGVRARRRERSEASRVKADDAFHHDFADAILRQFPRCPSDRAQRIARHAGQRRSGRIGRSAAGRALDEEAVVLAVVASVRHEDTAYDRLLMDGVDRSRAREEVRGDVARVLSGWRAPSN